MNQKKQFTSQQVNMALRTHSGFFVAKVTQFGFDIATGATENLHKNSKLTFHLNQSQTVVNNATVVPDKNN